MRTLTAALVSLLAVTSLFGTPSLVISGASSAQARMEGVVATSAVLGGDDNDDDDDDDDDDEELRVIA